MDKVLCNCNEKIMGFTFTELMIFVNLKHLLHTLLNRNNNNYNDLLVD